MRQGSRPAGLWMILLLAVILCGCVAEIHPPPPRPHPAPPPPPLAYRIHPGDLRVLDLDMSPDPAREGQRVRFRMTLTNASPHPGRVNLFIRDRDEVVVEAYDVMIRPGRNLIDFPPSGYRFRHQEHCFLVEVDIERTRSPIDVSRTFCARRIPAGWTLKEFRPAAFIVEDLDMNPDPALSGMEVRFRARIRNTGGPVRANVWIQDRNEIVTRMTDVLLRPGAGEYYFPNFRYAFQRSDHCFAVFIDVERIHQRVEAARTFCARNLGRGRGWSLRP